MDLTHVTVSEVVGQQYILKARTLSHIISLRNEKEWVFLPRKLSQRPSEKSHRLFS